MTTRRLAIAALAALALPASVRAQSLAARVADRIQPALTVVAAGADHRVDTQLGFERASGPLFGVQLDAVPFEGTMLSIRALGGALNAHSTAAEARDMGEITAVARLRLLPWLDARGGLTTRTFSSPLARQRWTSASIGADARIMMMDGRIEGTAGGQLLPIVHVSGHSSPDLAIATSMGLRHVSRRYVVALLYQLERYDFAKVGGRQRVEEHSTLLLRAGYRFGRNPSPQS